jgi:hypothetical protein
MPPEIITIVPPSAAMPMTAVCSRMLWVFSQVGKMSQRIAANSDQTPMSASSGPS